MKRQEVAQQKQRFARLGEAARILGARTGANLRQWFARGILPQSCLIDAGPRRILVDIEAATEALNARRRTPGQGKPPAPTPPPPVPVEQPVPAPAAAEKATS